MHFAFGVFDSFDQGGKQTGQVLRERLDFAVEAEKHGIDHYHVTEHHGTPLSVCPSPNLFLAALAQRTHTMRIGALVYVLSTYHPLRLAEEIATLDQLTDGRLDLGIGAGISPYELSYFGIAPEERTPRYAETWELLRSTLQSGRHPLTDGTEAELSILPVQQPYPSVWYATTNPNSANWAGSNGVSLAGRWNSGQFTEVAETYWNAWHARPGAAGADPLPRIGPSATVVVGESDQQALDLFTGAGTRFTNDLLKLWHEHDNAMLDDTYTLSTMIEKGNAVVGSVKTVTEAIIAQVENAAINYFEATLMFGTMRADQAHDNLSRFAEVTAEVRRAYPGIAQRRGGQA